MSKKSFLGSLMDQLVENESPQEPEAPKPSAPQQSYSGPAVSSFPSPVSSFQAPNAPYIGASTPSLTPEDQARMKQMSDQVYGIPSTYVTFQRVRESLNNTNDLQMVVKVMQATSPSLTLQKILADIDQHLDIIKTQNDQFEQTVRKARADRIDGPAQQIAQLQAESNDFAHRIEVNAGKIRELQSTTQEAERDIQSGASSFRAVVDQLNAPLLQTKQLLNTSH